MKYPLLILLFFASSAFANNLQLEIIGVEDAELNNIQLMLGELPTTEAERSNFLFSAKVNTEKALQAFSYFNAQINTQIDRNSTPWKLTIEIQQLEKAIVKSINISVQGEANQEPEFNHILNTYHFTIGTPLDQQKYESLKSALLSKGLELGYFDAHLERSALNINRENNSVDIELKYQSGTRYSFGDVTIDPVELEPWLLDSLIPISSGEKYSAKKLTQMQNQLQLSNYLAGITVQPLVDQAENLQIPVKASFKPAKSHSFEIGAGYADNHERLSFGWKTPRINRYGHNQETKLAYSKINPTGEIIYNIPINHPYNDILQIGLRLEDNEFGSITSKQYVAQINRIKNLDGWIKTYFTRYQKELWESNSEHLQANYLLPGLSLSRTTKSGSALDPSSGFSQHYTLELTDPALGSDSQLFRITGKLRWIDRISPKHRLVTRLHLGLIQVSEDDINLVAPSLRFFTGGDQSIRGFSYNSLGPSETKIDASGTEYKAVIGGTRLATASFEYQYYINDTWRIPLFIDAGQAFNNEKLNPVYTVGTGLHYLSPIGAIRLEVGYAISENDPPWRIHFTMGAEF